MVEIDYCVSCHEIPRSHGRKMKAESGHRLSPKQCGGGSHEGNKDDDQRITDESSHRKDIEYHLNSRAAGAIFPPRHEARRRPMHLGDLDF